MGYRHIDKNGHLNGYAQPWGNGYKFNNAFYSAPQLKAINVFQEVEPMFNPETQIVDSDWFYDAEKHIITKHVYDFEMGIKHNWKARFHLNGELYRTIRLRMRMQDILQGTAFPDLREKAIDMLMKESEHFRTNGDGTRNRVGDYMEVYLHYITDEDKAMIEGYIAGISDGNCILEYYNDLT